MSWLDSILGRRVALAAQARERLARWHALPGPRLDAAPEEARFVVADVETTGLDLRNDRLIAIGAVTVEAGRIDIGRSFYRVLRQPVSSSRDNILVHGIGGTEQCAGEDPVEALLAFLEFAGGSPLVAYHAAFDAAMIGRATSEYLGAKLRAAWVDLAYVAPALIRTETRRDLGLDAWLRRFAIEVFSRHDAVADALATAQLLLAVLAHADPKPRRVNELLWAPGATGWLGHGR
jgi:DNA polymerase-3 subunit epsilon